MVSESDLLTQLRQILGTSDLDTATAGSVRRELEKHFGVDLSDRKAFIRDQIDIYLDSQVAQGAAEEEEEVEVEVEVAENAQEVDEANQNDDVEVKDEEEEEEHDEGKNKRRKAPKKVEKAVGKRGGFKTVYSLSPQLQVVVGQPEMARPEVVKKIWGYIKERDLQDPNNRRSIRCDESLHAVFRVKSIDMFKMNKVLSKHIWPLNRESEPVKKMKEEEEESDHSVTEGDANNVGEKDEDEAEVKKEKGSSRKQTKKRRSAKVDKEVKKRGGGFNKLCSLSPELQKLTGESTLARTEVVKKLWNYIRENNLQDPKNRRTIICDEPLRTLFDVDSIDMFQMNKALSKHIWPLNQEAALDNDSEMEKRSQEEQEDSNEPDQDSKRQKIGD